MRFTADAAVAISLAVTGPDIDYEINVEGAWSSLPLTHNGTVSIRVGESTWNGVFDVQEWRLIGIEGAPNLENVVPLETWSSIAPFMITLEDFEAHIRRRQRVPIPTVRGGRPVLESEPPVMAAIGAGTLCRAGAAMGGAMIGGAICLGTGGAGCLLAVVLMAGVTEVFQDGCPA